MSDQWEFYASAMGDKTAYISFDYGVRDEIDQLPLAYAVKVRVLLKNPNKAGLPQEDEFQTLDAIEDDLSTFLCQQGGVYLGRITVDGARYFHGLCDVEETVLMEFCVKIHEQYGHTVGCLRDQDPVKNVYWQDLYPTEHDWQVIQDMKVIDNLRQNGDTLTIKRRIDHWLGFKDPDSRLRFKGWAESNGFGVEGLTERDENKPFGFWIQIFHEAVPGLNEITYHTIRLHDTAKQHDGDYDGWETSVEKG